MNVVQRSFVGGINTIQSPSKIPDDAFVWLVNGRNRFDKIQPINKHALVNAPNGVKNGVASIGDVLIAFIGGRAYSKTKNSDVFIKVPRFEMHPTAKYYTKAVPASYMNFSRKSDGTNAHADVELLSNFTVGGTPSGLVVQDGINQPWIIMYDALFGNFIARELHTYDEWNNVSVTANDREYVPIGKQMIYLNGILFIVAPDGKSIYRSVTGRPLDFVINVDSNGYKMPTEERGGAKCLSFAFDSDEITCIQEINLPDSFIYATANNVRVITLNYDFTLFSEPTFRETTRISAGVVNQYSFVEAIGDYLFVDKEGIVSFDAVQLLKFNARNAMISLNLSKLINGIKQDSPLAILYGNYVLFNVKTKWGNVVAVYDNLLNQNSDGRWTSLDITDINQITSYAIVETTSESRLYVTSADDKIYQMFADTDNVYPVTLFTKQYFPEESSVQHKSSYFRPVFNSPTNSNSNAYVTELVDGRKSQEVKQPIYQCNSAVKYPVKPPVVPTTKSQLDNPAFNIKDGLMGKGIQFIIQWSVNAELIEFQFMSNEQQSLASHKQASKTIQSTYGGNS